MVPATVTLSAAGLRSAGEGVGAAALEAAAGGAGRWRVKPPPGRTGTVGSVGGGSSGGALESCGAGLVTEQDTTVCASAAEAVRLVLSSSEDDKNVGKWFLQQHVEGKGGVNGAGGVFEVRAAVLVIGALRIELHRDVRGLDEAVSKSSSSRAAARAAVAETLRDAIVNAAKHRKCFLPFPNCFEVFAARVLLVRDGGGGGGDGVGSWRAWLLRLDDVFAEEKSGGGDASSSSSLSGHSLDALAADAVMAAAEAFSFHDQPAGEEQGEAKAFELVHDSSRGD